MQEHLRSTVFAIATAACALVLARSSAAQEVRFDGDEITLQFDEVDGTELEHFIKLCQIQTKLQLLYNQADVKDVKLKFVGEKRLPVDQFWRYFQAVLRAYDFVCVPYGNVTPPGGTPEGPETGFYAIRKSVGGAGGGAKPGFIKSQAPVVSIEQLESFKYDPGIVLTTSFTLKYVNVQEAANMLQTYFTDPMLESVRPVSNSNSVVITGYAQTLFAIKQLMQLIDVKPSEYEPKFARIALEFAVAEEIKPIVDQLIAAKRGVATNRSGVPQAGSAVQTFNQEPEPHVEADPRTNSLLIMAAPSSLEEIASYVRILDTEVDPRGDTHVYRLKNSAAKDLEEILNEWAQNSGAGSSGGGAGGGGGQPGATAGGGRSLEQPITVVADEASNSLIISASKSRYAQILEIVKKLDVRRRQVLIESALVEISGTLTENLGVELGYIDGQPGTSGEQGFGVTSFGLSELLDTNGDNIGDFRVPIGLQDGASGVTGITAGIFSGENFAVPVILQALKRTSDANVLSMPSILVNDNEEAVIRAINEQPTFNFTQGVNSDQTSFDEFVEAGITLNISPSISAGNYLRLAVKLEVSTFTEPTGNPPPKATREVDTRVTLPDGHTMVFGGVIQDDQRHSKVKVPFLGDLPLFGWIFGVDTDQDNRTNLYAFITPHIISDDFATLDELSYLRKRELEALNGKIYIVDPDWDRDNADTRVLDAGAAGVFDLPTYCSPEGGEVKPAPKPKLDSYPYGEQPASTGGPEKK